MLDTIELSKKYRAIKDVFKFSFQMLAVGRDWALFRVEGDFMGALDILGFSSSSFPLLWLVQLTKSMPLIGWEKPKGPVLYYLTCYVPSSSLWTNWFGLSLRAQEWWRLHTWLGLLWTFWAKMSFGFVPAGFLATRTVSFLSTWSCEDWHKYGDCELNERRRVIGEVSSPAPPDHIDVQVCLSTEDGFFVKENTHSS